MRLKKENPVIKNEKKKFVKNKTLIDNLQNIKTRYENTYLQNKIKKLNTNQTKEKLKEKNIKESYTINNFQNNSKIYKPNKKLQTKQNIHIKKGDDKNGLFLSNNKPITMNTNNNINIGNNINIITNNNISNNTNDNILKDMNNSQILRGYNIIKKDVNDFYENEANITNSNNFNRISRMNYDIGNMGRKLKGKNTSVEQRHRRINKDAIINYNDNYDEMNNGGKTSRLKNHIYPKPYKCNSPELNYNDSYKHQTFIDIRQEMLNDNINEIYNNNKYYNNYINTNNLRNLEENQKMFFNNNYNKINNNYFNINRKNYNTINDDLSKNIVNTQNIGDNFQNKTLNNFYAHRSPVATIRNINRNYNNNFFNYIQNKKNNDVNKSPRGKGHVNSMIMEGNYQIAPLDNYKDNIFDNNNNVRNNGFKTSRRSKNKIRITKSDNPAIVEYNLDISDINDDDNCEYQGEFNIRNNFNNNRFNDYKYETNYNYQKDLEKYYNFFTKNIKPITNYQFNIYGSNSNNISKNNNNCLSSNSSNTKQNYLTNYETTSNNNLISTPNFSETGKTPKRPIGITTKKMPLNNKDFIENNSILNKNINLNFDEENSPNRILVKKRPKNEIPVPTLSNRRRNSTSNLNIYKNNNYKLNYFYEICKNENINYNPDKNIQNKNNEDNNKFCFNNENEIIEYINKKYEEEKKKKNYFNKKLRFTGFVLSKKYKGKNLYDIRIEDDIDKINNQFKEERVIVSDKQVVLKFFDDINKTTNNTDNLDNKEDKINELDEENKKLKLENERLNKKDIVKNDLITKLDKEKQKLLEEIEKLTNNIEELKNINTKLIEDKNNNVNDKETDNTINLNKKILFKIERNSLEIKDTIKENSINNNENSNLKINEEKNLNDNDKNDINNLNIDILKNDLEKEKTEQKNDENENHINASFNNNQMLSDIINSENIDEKINDINIENYCNNNNYSIDNNINGINNDKNDFMDITDTEEIIKIDEINKNINFGENKEITNNHVAITESSNGLEINDQSHPRIHDLAESEFSEKEDFNKNE